MLTKLQEEADADATKNAYCNKETTETASSKDDKTSELEGLNTKIDQRKAKSTKLKEQVSTLQNELASMAQAQAQETQLRQEEKAAYKQNKADLEQGVRGIRMALKVVKDYLGKEDKSHESQEGGEEGIVGMLEVILSDFSKGLSEVVTQEEEAAADYDEATKANDVERVEKTKDVDYKKKAYKALDKAGADIESDASGSQTELDAILQYERKIDQQCIATADPYAERKQRREKEIAELKDAVNTLEEVTNA